MTINHHHHFISSSREPNHVCNPLQIQGTLDGTPDAWLLVNSGPPVACKVDPDHEIAQVNLSVGIAKMIHDVVHGHGVVDVTIFCDSQHNVQNVTWVVLIPPDDNPPTRELDRGIHGSGPPWVQ